MQVTVEDQSFTLSQGDLCVIAPGTVHYVTLPEGAGSMGFRFRFFCTGRAENEEQSLFTHAFGSLKNVFIIHQNSIIEKYIRLASENMKHTGTEFIASTLLFLALYETVSVISGEERGGYVDEIESVDIALSENIENYINQNYNRRIMLSDLAEHMNLGVRQTERIIKRLFGLTFGNLLLQKRLAVAKLLLRTTEKSLEEIAQACGFDDKSYFCRRFREAMATSPGKYREHME